MICILFYCLLQNVPTSLELGLYSVNKMYKILDSRLKSFLLLFERYTYGKTIDGGFHCRFGIKKDEPENNAGEIEFIKGLEKTGSVSRNRPFLSLQDK